MPAHTLSLPHPGPFYRGKEQGSGAEQEVGVGRKPISHYILLLCKTASEGWAAGVGRNKCHLAGEPTQDTGSAEQSCL